ncbi:DUF2461 domain-containing protein [Adhaeribacter soli]|uniref:DUF2461 domain-containing protein n=2 Tax=Adhaeribacter soli TaxID=2607655 RepID=A0A5N1IU52_9BACT|nr:DUF2461 domain-containing protein [Adhaeribacter soli]
MSNVKTMPYFTADFFRFFEQLSGNNNQEWFEDNRSLYDEAVKRPFKELVQEMIDRISMIDKELRIPVTDAMFRIQKDTRFSRDKTPFNTHMSANISHGGKKSKECPGFFFRISPEKITVGGGTYDLEKDNLTRVRHHIEDEMERFNSIVCEEAFVQKYGCLQGERNKVIPKELRDLYEEQPLIANKQFFYSADIDPNLILEENLPDLLMEYYHAGKPVNDFLREAIR